MARLAEILDRVAGELGPVDGEPVALTGGITNHNFRVRFGERACMLRLPGQDTALLGIDRSAERLANERAAQLRIAPAVLYGDGDCLVTAFVDDAELDGDRLRAAPHAVARALRAFHDSGLSLPTRFWIPALLSDYARILGERGVAISAPYRQTVRLVDRIATVLPLEDPVPCHNDLLPGNLIAPHGDPDRALLIDWEYAGVGHRMFDLANLAVNNAFDDAAREQLLRAYFDQPPTPGRRAALALFTLVSDAREAAWGVVQTAISALDFDFGAYAETHFTRLLATASDERRLEGWLHDAAA